jgi:hypothetical protein
MSRLRLSEAIRLGSLLLPDPQAGNTKSCAIGMALLAHGLVPVGADYNRIRRLYRWLEKSTHPCPWCSQTESGIWLIAHPFDAHVTPRQITLDQLCE